MDSFENNNDNNNHNDDDMAMKMMVMMMMIMMMMMMMMVVTMMMMIMSALWAPEGREVVTDRFHCIILCSSFLPVALCSVSCCIRPRYTGNLYIRRRQRWRNYDNHQCRNRWHIYDILMMTKLASWHRTPGDFVVIESTGGCHYNTIQCHQWRQSWCQKFHGFLTSKIRVV